MSEIYSIDRTDSIITPALVFFTDLIKQNIRYAISMVDGDASRLRPHVKTHKTKEVAQMELAEGISKHKCATLAEAEMLAEVGATDIFLAYNLVGINCQRMAKLMQRYPECRFIAQVDHPLPTKHLSEVMHAADLELDVLLDLNIGQHRTGIAPGDDAKKVYAQINDSPGLRPVGLHAYDGHNHQESQAERQQAVDSIIEQVLSFRAELESEGLPVPSIIAGGTPTFPMFAKLDIPGLECSPGTCFLHDMGYSKFNDLEGFTPAALLLTRVISKPTDNRVTLDLGYKAVASDPPAGKRCKVLNLSEYQAVIQNEEHLVLETSNAAQINPGDEFLAIPTHICPTCALHKQAYIVEQGQLTGTWDIVGRDRILSI